MKTLKTILSEAKNNAINPEYTAQRDREWDKRKGANAHSDIMTDDLGISKRDIASKPYSAYYWENAKRIAAVPTSDFHYKAYSIDKKHIEYIVIIYFIIIIFFIIGLRDNCFIDVVVVDIHSF